MTARRSTDPIHDDHVADLDQHPVVVLLADRLDRHERETRDRLADVLTEVRRLADAVADVQRGARDAEVREEARRELLAERGETSGVHESPIRQQPAPSVVVVEWVAQWSPWQVLVGVALVVGGPTVAEPAVDRLLSVLLPAPPHTVEVVAPAPSALPDLRESPADTGPELDTPIAPRPTL